MNILVINRHRPENVTEPLDAVDQDYNLIVPGKNKWLADLADIVTSSKQSHQYDLILSDGGGFPGVISCVISVVLGLPLVLRLGGDMHLSNKEARRQAINNTAPLKYGYYKIMYLVNSLVIRLSDKIIVVSNDTKERLREKSKLSNTKIKTVYVPNTFEINTEQEKKHVSEPITITTVTNLNFRLKKEAIVDALPAIGKIASEFNIEYRIAGGGEYLENLRRIIEQSPQPIQHTTNALGYINKIEEEYERADIFLYISYIDGYPRAVLEAQASGLPVVANRKFGMKEQVSHGETGYLVSDIEEIYEYVKKLIENPKLATEIGERAQNSVKRDNSPERIGNEYVDVFDSIAETD